MVSIPVHELSLEVLQVAEAAAAEEAQEQLVEAALDAGLAVGGVADGHHAELVVGGEIDKPRVEDGLVTLPAQHHRFLAVIDATMRCTPEALEGVPVAIPSTGAIPLPSKKR